MPRRQKDAEIRSGRFRASEKVKLVKGAGEERYRVINGGNNPIKIEGIDGGTKTIPVNCSFDFKTTSATVTVESDPPNRLISGACEFLNASQMHRPGRFTKPGVTLEVPAGSPAGTPAVDPTPLEIVHGAETRRVYRVINGSLTADEDDGPPLRVKGSGTVRVAHECSVDITVASTLSIHSLANDIPLAGAYELVATDRGIKAGRFRFKATAAGNAKQTIILFKESQARLYRIVNAGQTRFKIHLEIDPPPAGHVTELVNMRRRQSFDFVVPESKMGKTVRVEIEATVGETVEGTIEYLGSPGLF